MARLVALLALSLASCAASDASVQGADELSPRGRSALERAWASHRELFGSEPDRLSLRVFDDSEDPAYTYDSFDHERGEIQLHWPSDDETYGEWALVHELAQRHERGGRVPARASAPLPPPLQALR
jgi:hypothetical protein